VRAQIFRKLLLLASAPDRGSTKSHVPRKLDTKMPKAANALHSDRISGAQAGVAKSVVLEPSQVFRADGGSSRVKAQCLKDCRWLSINSSHGLRYLK
jgi:hypothetical protein